MVIKSKTNYKTFLFLFSILTYSGLIHSWDFNKGGSDWAKSCKTGPQAPIDISQPFEYLSKYLHPYIRC